VEYITLSEAMCEAKWLAALYDKLGYQVNRPIKIFSDNNRSIAIATNPPFYKQSKDITIRYHWIRQQIQDGLLQIHPCWDPQQTANILTKALTPEKHNQHIAGLGISTAWGGVLGTSLEMEGLLR
jgi:hypothetical protein